MAFSKDIVTPKTDMNENYTADNIKILNDPLRFDYQLTEHLAKKYGLSAVCIRRGVEACRLAGVDPAAYFVPRYLDGDKSIPEIQVVTDIHKELQRESQQ